MIDRDTILGWARANRMEPTVCMHGVAFSGPNAQWECAQCVALLEDDEPPLSTTPQEPTP